MVKLDLSIEQIENSYILEIDGKRYSCKSPNEIARKIMLKLNPEFIPMRYRIVENQSERMKAFLKDKIRGRQKEVLELFNEFPILTADIITDKLWNIDMNIGKWQYRGNTVQVLNSLVRKELIKRINNKNAKVPKFSLVKSNDHDDTAETKKEDLKNQKEAVTS